MSSPSGSFIYTLGGSSATSSLIRKIGLPNGSYITNTYDNVARLLTTKLLNSSSAVLNSHSYGYNAANHRTALTNFAGNYVSYTYDLIGQLKTAVGREPTGATRMNENFGYFYDAAGNLNQRTNDALVQTFAVNNLNELSTVTRSGTLIVGGNTTSTATNITVNSLPATIYSDATFAKNGFSLADGSNTFTAIAQDGYGRMDTNTVSVSLPTTSSCIYDSNGNLTSDGTRGFDYDDENQLIRVTVTNSWKSEFVYDGRMRRRIRKEFIWRSGAWVQSNEVRYIFAGSLEIQTRDGNNLPTVTFTRGRDLSGSLRGAGGIGGLLARTDAASAQTTYFQADGNGNITALVNSEQVIVAKYLYDAFGNTLSKSGELADANLYRFSSKEYHPSSGLYHYRFRYYEPNLQRWLTTDPLQEAAGVNVHGLSAINQCGQLIRLDWTPYSQAKLHLLQPTC